MAAEMHGEPNATPVKNPTHVNGHEVTQPKVGPGVIPGNPGANGPKPGQGGPKK